MTVISPFTPIGSTKHITVAGTSASVALPVRDSATGAWGSRTVRVCNRASETVFIEFGIDTVAAVVATSLPILPGSVEFLEINSKNTHVAAIGTGATGTIDFTEGEGN